MTLKDRCVRGRARVLVCVCVCVLDVCHCGCVFECVRAILCVRECVYGCVIVCVGIDVCYDYECLCVKTVVACCMRV